jgi:3-oxoacyl-[acyl-carrier-protein] synthase II
MEQVVITGIGVEVPGLSNAQSLLVLQEPLSLAEFEPAQKLGRQGLRYKNRATILALCAVHDALLDAGLPVPKLHEPEATGVIVSSNLGNVDTVCRMVQTLRQGSVEDLSPMDVPNASSNVIATTIAIRFDCRAVNLMLCNGATSGLDVFYVAANVIRAGRARRMLVIGVEPRNNVVDRLMVAAQETGSQSAQAIHLADGAACVVLEAASAATGREARVYGNLSDYCYISPQTDAASAVRRVFDGYPTHLWLTPNQQREEVRSIVDRVLATWEGVAPETLDLNVALGELYGALGVFQVVAACLWLQQPREDRGAAGVTVATSGGIWGDGMACLRIARISDPLKTRRQEERGRV